MNEVKGPLKSLTVPKCLVCLVLAAGAMTYTALFLLFVFRIILSAVPVVLIGLGFLLLFLFLSRTKNGFTATWISVLCFTVGSVLLLLALWFVFFGRAGYRDVDKGKSDLYAGQKVMILFPHQDDEILMTGGIAEEYLKYGSEVYLPLYTNGDYYNIGEERLNELLNVSRFTGIPEDHVIFLGYADGWKDTDIYLLPEDEVAVSLAGRSATYGLPSHPAYHNGAPYTRGQIVSDLESVVSEYRPDTIICVDMDNHDQHQELSLFFDEALRNILKETTDYHPFLLKSFAYSMSLSNPSDFYEKYEVGSTAWPLDTVTGYVQANPSFLWADRIRFPVRADTLSRSLIGCKTHIALHLYPSQHLYHSSVAIVNSDRLFWQRPTDSVLYNADITCSSGSSSVLNDFKRIGSTLFPEKENFREVCWIPENADPNRTAEVKLDAPHTLTEIWLFDNPDPESNILNALITLDDGTEIRTGPLAPNGSETVIHVDKAVSSFSVKIDDAEGPAAGLSEIEAYCGHTDYNRKFIKLMNSDEDFVYDYQIDAKGSEVFSLYAFGCSDDIRDYLISCDNPHCSVQTDNGSLLVRCPSLQSCTVTVSSPDGSISDSIRISNPTRFLSSFAKSVEGYLCFSYKNCFTQCEFYRFLIRKFPNRLGNIL